MAAAGQAFENPLTGERMVFDKTARDSNGLLLEIEFFIQPNTDKDLLLKSEAFFETLYALAQDGKTGADGLPKNLLQKVVVGQALEPASYSATPPLWIQRPLFGLLAAIGRAFGYSGYYPAQYVLP